jgi:hypothetical protein
MAAMDWLLNLAHASHLEVVLLIAGLAAAVVLGVAWALRLHKIGESVDMVGHAAITVGLALAALEGWSEYNKWTDELLHPDVDFTFNPDGTITRQLSLPPPAPPSFWHQVGHIAGQAIVELVRDLAIALVVFGLLYLILKAVKKQPAGD